MQPSETTLDALGIRLIADLRQTQRALGLRASGESADSPTHAVTRQARKVRLTITGASWWYYQQHGRRADTRPGRPSTWLVQTIRAWIRQKGLSIPLSAAGAIAYKIKNEGITVPNRHNRGGVLSVPLATDRIKTLLIPDLKQQYLSYIRSQVMPDTNAGRNQ